MRRTAVLIMMLLALLWQSTAMARIGSTVNVLKDLKHAALHWQGQSHHHHEDGTYHLDDSNESMHHMVTDHVSVLLAMAEPVLQVIKRPDSTAPTGQAQRVAPNPTLDGLLRPPRPHA